MKMPSVLASALLLLGVAVVSAPASAEEVRPVRATVSYDPADSAERIYASIERAAERACTDEGRRPLTSRKAERACTTGMLNAGVKAIGRPDIAALHSGGLAATGLASRG